MTKPTTEPEEPSRTAGACVLIVLVGAVTAGVFAVSPTVGVLALWVVGILALWRAARRRVSDSSATPPPAPAAPLHGEVPDQELPDGTTLVTREGMLIYRKPDPRNPQRTTVRIEQTADETHA